MSLDEHIRELFDRAALEVTRAAAADRERAVALATESALADTRARADVELAQIQDAAQQHIDALHQATETRIIELTTALEEARDRARQEAERGHAERLQAGEQIGGLHASLADLESRLALAQRDVEAAREAARAQSVEFTLAADDRGRAFDRALEAARVAAHDSEQAGVTRLLQALRRMDEAATLGDVLDALAAAVERETGRLALFVVRADRLLGWHVAGFGAFADVSPRDVDLSAADAGLAGDVLRGGDVRVVAAGAADVRSPFGAPGDGCDAMALPVTVGGAVAAVVYAEVPCDAGATPVSSGVVEILTRHAGRALEALTQWQLLGVQRPPAMARASHPELVGSSHDGGMP